MNWECRFKLPPKQRPKVKPRCNFKYKPRELKEGKDPIWDKYLGIRARRVQMRAKKREASKKVHTLTAKEVADSMGLNSSMSGNRYIRRVEAKYPEAVISLPTGEKRLRKDCSWALKEVYTKDTKEK